MRLFLNILLTYLILIITLLTPAIANDEEVDDLFSLTLADLLQTQVISSNGIKESLIDAPAAMLIISAKQIEQRGYRTPFTTRTLLMIDGRVENNLWSQRVLLSRQYPINMISRIEILYGPASVKYGANAFLGVVNLITKK